MRKNIKNIHYLNGLVRKQLILLSHFLILSFSYSLSAQPTDVKARLADYFAKYTNPAYTSNDPIRLTDVQIDEEQHCVRLLANAGFASQPFTPETVSRIHREVERLMPPPYNTWRILILANGTPIEELVPLALSDSMPELRRWGDIEFKGNPWVSPLSQPYSVTQGMQGRHFTVWPSHGRYFDSAKGMWQWQRPRLYCTTEDIFTQSFVLPFLIPMLENAGACVFTPRERDWQRHEVIVDNDMNPTGGKYTETNGTYDWEQAGTGFCKLQDVYFDNENPFEAGTCRRAETQTHSRHASKIVWQPNIPADGRYAVYVSYKTLPTSVSDAEYIVRHRGISTRFRVNQQMGGGTWVYLGTFDFAAGSSPDNSVLVSNKSNYRGTVTADAVRFGGGMGSISRGDSIHSYVRSAMPRFLEGSRYYAQWAGMPYKLYKNKEGVNDYGDDINIRSLMSNRLARGSVYLPGDSGLCVPIELSLAVHSDAGYRQDMSHIGTLGIYTTGLHTQTSETFEGALAEGLLPSGKSRLMSRDLCDMVMTQVDSDLRMQYDNWNRRQMYDKNYSETREPEVPGMILETLSHQNFADLVRGHDPVFKMLLSRAIYKGIAKYTAAVHSLPAITIQPLPVKDFSAILDEEGDSVQLSWYPVTDPNEPTSIPTGFVVYTSEGSQGYDNGRVAYRNHMKVSVQRGVLTRFMVRAINEGGASMPSEELCVYAAPEEKHRLLIVNDFDRLAGPQPIDTEISRGFSFDTDPGVVYQHSPSYCGRQLTFDKNGFNRRDAAELGFSGNEFEGMLMAGNTFDFTTQHATDFLLSHPELSISSCSYSVVEQKGVPRGIHIVDLIAGAQRADGYSTLQRKTFSEDLCNGLSHFTQGGGSLLVSGAYVGEDIDSTFASQVLHAVPDGSYALADSTSMLTGMNTQIPIYYMPNEERYSVRRLSVLLPTNGAFASVSSTIVPRPLSVAFEGEKYRSLTYGFPLECICNTGVRQAVMRASLEFLLNK